MARCPRHDYFCRMPFKHNAGRRHRIPRAWFRSASQLRLTWLRFGAILGNIDLFSMGCAR